MTGAPTHSLPFYVVLSVEKDPAAASGGHSHVIGLTTSDPDRGETRWTVVEVITAIRDGARFVLDGGGQSPVTMEPAVCPRCPFVTLVVEPVGVEQAAAD